jgi:glycosyltransferase involved in cell wall biosynthesis
MDAPMTPRVSVLMPVYNGEAYLVEAVRSILSQTFSDFEFVIVNDGSTDRTQKIISSFTDSRIRVLDNEKNLGIIESLNRGVQSCDGEYIARMDADDVSLPDRLRAQVSFLDMHPNLQVVGTQMTLVNECGTALKTVRQPLSHTALAFLALFNSPLFHPTIMARAKILKENPYDPAYRHAEDYELWSRLLMKSCHLARLDTPFLRYRSHGASISKQNLEAQQLMRDTIRKRNLECYVSPVDVSLLLKTTVSGPFNALDVMRAYLHLVRSFVKKEKPRLSIRLSLYSKCWREGIRVIGHSIKRCFVNNPVVSLVIPNVDSPR